MRRLFSITSTIRRSRKRHPPGPLVGGSWPLEPGVRGREGALTFLHLVCRISKIVENHLREVCLVKNFISHYINDLSAVMGVVATRPMI